MRKMPRFVSLILAGTLLMGAAGSAFAWKNADFVSFPASGCWHGAELFADDWDVVTVDKWNQAFCYTRRLYTVFFWSAENGLWTDRSQRLFGWVAATTGGAITDSEFGGLLVTEVNLPARTYGAADGYGRSYAGAVHFKDQNLGYYGSGALAAGTWKGGILYRPDREAMDLASIGWTYIWKVGTNESRLLGWEKISITDTTPFDPLCQYRFQSADNSRYYYVTTVTTGALHLTEDNDWSNSTYEKVFLVISSTSKTNISHQSEGGVIVAAHWTVSIIEKFCLPSYNPNNIP